MLSVVSCLSVVCVLLKTFPVSLRDSVHIWVGLGWVTIVRMPVSWTGLIWQSDGLRWIGSSKMDPLCLFYRALYAVYRNLCSSAVQICSSNNFVLKYVEGVCPNAQDLNHLLLRFFSVCQTLSHILVHCGHKVATVDQNNLSPWYKVKLNAL